MKTLWFSLAVLPLLISCESTGTASIPSRSDGHYAAATASPFTGAAPPSDRWSPPDRYYAFGGGYSQTRRQTEGDDVNFLRYSPTCRKHWHCGYDNGCGYSSCGYGYSFYPRRWCY